MDVRLIVDVPRSGAINMGVDEALLELSGELPVLRIYRWSEPTLSLGYFQLHGDRRLHAESARCPMVRRSTGGGAILHDQELTYSFVWPAGPRSDPQPVYDLFHQSLQATLRRLGAAAELCPAAQPRAPEPFLCFQRRASGDLLLQGHKVGGSAQRRKRRAALQHGSILWQQSPAAPQLPGIADLCPAMVTLEEFQERWLEELQRQDHELLPSVLSQQELDVAAAHAAHRFDSRSWRERRWRCQA